MPGLLMKGFNMGKKNNNQKGKFHPAKTPEGRRKQHFAIEAKKKQRQQHSARGQKQHTPKRSSQQRSTTAHESRQQQLDTQTPNAATVVSASTETTAPKKKVPVGRTLSTYDMYLPGSETGSAKKRAVVVIEVNDDNELAVVPLTTTAGSNRTRLKYYQQGQSLFKHYVIVVDNEGQPIVIGSKFRANHQNMDMTSRDVAFITDTVYRRASTAAQNMTTITEFRQKKKP